MFHQTKISRRSGWGSARPWPQDKGRAVDLFIERSGERALSVQLYDQVREAIVEGRLRAGDPVPPSRQLAETLGVARHTVTTAYGRLTAEGFLEGRSGGGSVVAATAQSVTAPPRRATAIGPSRRLSGWSPRPAVADLSVRYDMRPGRPDPSLFP